MHLCIWVGAAIADDDQPIIQIAGVANGRQHAAAGVDTGEHQRVDAVGAQQRLQVGANERADAGLTTIGFPLVPWRSDQARTRSHRRTAQPS